MKFVRNIFVMGCINRSYVLYLQGKNKFILLPLNNILEMKINLREFGNTGIKVFPLGFGGGHIGGNERFSDVRSCGYDADHPPTALHVHFEQPRPDQIEAARTGIHAVETEYAARSRSFAIPRHFDSAFTARDWDYGQRRCWLSAHGRHSSSLVERIMQSEPRAS